MGACQNGPRVIDDYYHNQKGDVVLSGGQYRSMGATMNDKSNNSLISAYHDGELSAAERAEVERLLSSSPEARAELEAYRRVSKVMREAGRPKLTADLTPSVMQAIKQQPARRGSTQPQKGTSRAGWTRWTTMAAVAASLIITVVIISQPGAGPDVAVVKPDDKTNTNVPNNNVPANVVTSKPPIAVVENNNTPANKTSTAPQLVQLNPKDLPLDLIENLKNAQPGKIVRFLKQSGKDVAVFHLMVLDTAPGLESLQMILSAQQISGPKSQVGASGVMAVYVEAKQDQLDKVIAELQKEDQKQFVALAMQAAGVKAEDMKKVVKPQSADMAAQQVPLKNDELKSLGVAPVESQQIEFARNSRQGRTRSVPFAEKNEAAGHVTPMKKVLIVLEKVPESLMPKSTPQPN